MPVNALKSQTEVELKFRVPSGARAAVAVEMARGAATHQRMSLAARYLDTEDRRLARQSMAWRLRREGHRWIQTLKAPAANSLERFEHEVVRPDASHDASEHAGTPVGDRFVALLRRARADGLEPCVRFQTEIRRTTRRIRTQGAVVEVAFDEGRMFSAGASQRVREIEFELISGSTSAMLALAERWRKRFGLIYDPRSKAERGDQLAEGSPFAPVRKASLPNYARRASAIEAFRSAIDECLAQITRNAIGLIEGDPTHRVEHVHQLRVGIRRIRSAVRSFQGWAPSPPVALVEGLRRLFSTLGLARERDVLDDGVVAEIRRFGAPPLALPAVAAGPDPVVIVGSSEAQRIFLAWIAWRANLDGMLDVVRNAVADKPETEVAGVASPTAQSCEAEQGVLAPDDAPTFRRNLQRRLRRSHRRLIADSESFDELDEASLHALRKRTKRQRYTVEFFAPLLKRKKAERYLNALALFQDRMGELNDLFVARARYQLLVVSDPAAWFALGWLAARIADVRALAKSELGRLARVDPPTP